MDINFLNKVNGMFRNSFIDFSKREIYWIIWEYNKYVLSSLTWIVGPIINLISGTHNYVRVESIYLWYSFKKDFILGYLKIK